MQPLPLGTWFGRQRWIAGAETGEETHSPLASRAPPGGQAGAHGCFLHGFCRSSRSTAWRSVDLVFVAPDSTRFKSADLTAGGLGDFGSDETRLPLEALVEGDAEGEGLLFGITGAEDGVCDGEGTDGVCDGETDGNGAGEGEWVGEEEAGPGEGAGLGVGGFCATARTGMRKAAAIREKRVSTGTSRGDSNDRTYLQS